AIKISTGQGNGRIGLYLLGGVHGCELGSSDILITFVNRLGQAYADDQGMQLPNGAMTAQQIRTILEKLDIVVFPSANPDGRTYSMNHPDIGWKKNRRVQAPSSAAKPGVDL